MRRLEGVWAILATPFDDGGRLDLDSLRSLVEFEIQAGVDGLTILGVMGEAHKLSDEERGQVVRATISAAHGRVPVAVGVSHTGTDVAVRLAREAEAAGAAAVMAAAPTNLGNLDAVAEYYRRVAGAVQVPVIVQDEPNATRVTLPASFLVRVAEELPTARTIKLEDPPTPAKISQIRDLTQLPLDVFGGLGGTFFLEELNRGACGTMTGFAFPEILIAIHRHFVAGRKDRARDVFYRYLPYIRFEGQALVGLAIRKEVLRLRGAIACSATRHPGMKLDPGTRAELLELIEHLELRPGSLRLE